MLIIISTQGFVCLFQQKSFIKKHLGEFRICEKLLFCAALEGEIDLLIFKTKLKLKKNKCTWNRLSKTGKNSAEHLLFFTHLFTHSTVMGSVTIECQMY